MDFAAVCQMYFPRWRSAHQWTLREGSRDEGRPGHGTTRCSTERGYCDRQQRVLWVADGNTATLIHEICHAVAQASHGQRFRARLQQAARCAARRGETALADALVQDAEQYASHEAARRTRQALYAKVRDLVMDLPGVPFEEVLASLAATWGVPPATLQHWARRLRQVYTQAQRTWGPDTARPARR